MQRDRQVILLRGLRFDEGGDTAVVSQAAVVPRAPETVPRASRFYQ